MFKLQAGITIIVRVRAYGKLTDGVCGTDGCAIPRSIYYCYVMGLFLRVRGIPQKTFAPNLVGIAGSVL